MKKILFLFTLYFTVSGEILAVTGKNTGNERLPLWDNDSGSLVRMRIDDLKRENEKLWQLLREAEDKYQKKIDEEKRLLQASLDKNEAETSRLQALLRSTEDKLLSVTRIQEEEKLNHQEKEERHAKIISGLEKELSDINNKNRLNLKDNKVRQSYVSGVMFSQEILTAVSNYHSMDLDTDIPALVAGLSDGMNHSVRIDTKNLDSEKDKLVQLIQKREQEAYSKALAIIKKQTKGKDIVKQNQTAFFVLSRKGGEAFKSGDKVTYNFRIEKFDGTLISDETALKAVYNDSLPYLLSQAFTFAKQGGEVEIYGIATDFYQPGDWPQGINITTPIKVTVDIK